MPLDSYGVLVGTLEWHYRDAPDGQGRWSHVNLRVSAPAGWYRCAVDVDSEWPATGVRWRRLTLHPTRLPVLVGLPSGYHPLAMTAASGAVDHVRHPALRSGARAGPRAWLARAGAWRSGSNVEAAAALESMLAVGARIAVFGEPLGDGLGMRNVHQNQGDPPGSRWHAENGPWQDGATVAFRRDGLYEVFLSKFTSQA